MDLAGRKERGKAYCPIVVGSGIVPLPEKKTVKTIKTVVLECTKRLQDFTRVQRVILSYCDTAVMLFISPVVLLFGYDLFRC